MSSTSDALKNWIPLKISGESCEWLYTGEKKFTEPFFTETILACKNLAENSAQHKVVSEPRMINEWSNGINTVAPSAIIFHVSRCGSTLLSQLLSLDEKHIVLSEVPFFDEVLRLPYKNDAVSFENADIYFKNAVKFYGQKKSGKEKHLFIKTDSWHLHFYERLRNLFPSVPFILLYRNPVEVIHSQQRQRGMQSVPGIFEPGIFGFSQRQIKETNLDLYMANVLESYFKKMLEIFTKDPLTLAVDYKEGIKNILKKVCTLTGINLAKKSNGQIRDRSRFHGKHPQQLFKEDYRYSNVPDFLLNTTELYKQLNDISSRKH